MAKGCSAALAVIWIATVAHALTTPVSMVLTPSTGGLGVQRLLPSLKNKVAPKATALWEKTTTKIETIRDRVTGKTERELQAEREALMEEVELLRESNAAVGRLQQKTAAELEATKAKSRRGDRVTQTEYPKGARKYETTSGKEGRDRAASCRE